MADVPYDRKFLENTGRIARHAATVVVPTVMELLNPSSVCDVGCGIGSWLAVFREHGAGDVLGIDGDYVPPDALAIPPELYLERDLTGGVELDRRFDLAVSLEVAEHLPADAAAGFVDSLVALAPAVLFSAAIPQQGGRNHVNEQWPDYWAEHFARHGYLPVDCIRPRIWDRPGVAFWYQQNILIFAEPSLLEGNAKLKAEHELSRSRPLNLVHPDQFQFALTGPHRRLRRIAELKEAGEISQEEFERLRSEVLSEL
jgi:hypothetical protein